MTAFKALLQNLMGAAKPAPVFEINQIADDDWEVLRVTPETFTKAELIADTLCLAAEITYISDEGIDKVLGVIIREIRKFDKNTYLMKVEYHLNGKTELLSSDRTIGICAGPFGKIYTTQKDESGIPIEKLVHAESKKKASTQRPDLSDRPGIQTFFKMFEIFANQGYYALRLKINLLKFLAKSLSTTKSKAEIDFIRKWIAEQNDVKSEDVEALGEYAEYSLVTNTALKETIDKIHLIPNADLKSTLEAAKVLISTGGPIAPHEQNLYDQLLKAL